MTSRTLPAAIPARLNLGFVAAVLTANVCLFVVLPLSMEDGRRWLAWLVAPLVLTTVPHWALIHEAIHGHLHPHPRTNDRLGRLLAVLFLSPFDTLRFGHLSHHALNARPTERPDVFDPRRTSRLRATLLYYPRLFFGLFLVELGSGPLSLLPRPLLRPIVRRLFYDGADDAQGMADRAERQLLGPGRLARIRTDAAASLLVVAVGLWLYGGAWPVLVVALLGRAFVVSFLDNAPHYDGPLAEPDQGYDMAAPAPVRFAVLNTNFHGVHHRHPNLPWPALPAAFAAEGRCFHGRYLLTPWRQLRGPIPATALQPSAFQAQESS